ncbi:protein of unknown function [Nitrospira japonica]|uniref:Uncharacterized protein n=1 Tax=Nitrospira japonica TaxID=1325564 RepID=A0A1W1I9V8_9BACT|nr:protein of unknown function [Nitrospira japonica]
MFVEDRGDVRFRDFGIPGAIRIHDDRWALLAGAEAGRPADQHFPRHDATLHQAHIERHEQLRRALAAAGGFWVTRRPGVGADDDVIFRLRHECSFFKIEWRMARTAVRPPACYTL